MKPYSLIIYYNNLADLRERLHDHLEELEARAAEPAAPSIIDMPMTEIVGSCCLTAIAVPPASPPPPSGTMTRRRSAMSSINSRPRVA